jgi:hypothetical protein
MNDILLKLEDINYSFRLLSVEEKARVLDELLKVAQNVSHDMVVDAIPIALHHSGQNAQVKG